MVKLTGIGTFINRLRSHFNGASKKYYITGAPQCPYPDGKLWFRREESHLTLTRSCALGNMQAMLNGASFDAVYVQFCAYSLSFPFSL